MAVREKRFNYREKHGSYRLMEVITVDTRNLDGLERAESLKNKGWELTGSFLNKVEFKREIKEKS